MGATGALQIIGASFESKLLRALLALISGNGSSAILCRTDKQLQQVKSFVEHFLQSMDGSEVGEGWKVLELPLVRLWGSERFGSHTKQYQQRAAVLAAQAENHPRTIIVTTLQGMCQLTLPIKDARKYRVEVEVGKELDLDEFETDLKNMGYFDSMRVEVEARYVFKGGIIDVFPAGFSLPIRIELMGDMVSSIRSYDPDSQVSKSSTQKCTISLAQEVYIDPAEKPAKKQELYEVLLEEVSSLEDRQSVLEAFDQDRFYAIGQWLPLIREESSSFLENFQKTDYRYIALEPISILEQEVAAVVEECREAYDASVDFHVDHHFRADKILLEGLRQECFLAFGTEGGLEQLESAKVEYVKDRTLTGKGWKALLTDFVDDAGSTQVYVLCRSASEVESIQKTIEQFFDMAEINSVEVASGPREVVTQIKQVRVEVGYLQNPIQLLPEAIYYLPSSLFLGRQANVQSQQKRLANAIRSYEELKVGDFVVEVQHGVARYLGLKKLDHLGQEQVFLHLEYAGNDKLYVPIDKVDGIEKYGGSDFIKPVLDKLSSSSWSTRKARVAKVTQEIAEDLLKIHAKRAVSKPRQYAPVNELYIQFEQDFPFLETADQLKAIADLNGDFEAKKSMDRLIVGDVGFGKTEVAMRACMRAVLEDLQVIVLAPTTVLSYQHFKSFKKRFAKYGVRFALANRFVKPSLLRNDLEQFTKGEVDIFIGTHRLLGKDVEAKKLGLVVIDEEQKFGVQHKEAMKKLKASADILSLSATPIPRTLHSAVLGLKDVSVLLTPPSNRMAVKTYQISRNDELIQDAILVELKRGGQVFVIHNRVEDIDTYAGKISGLVPNAKVRVGHAQMHAHKLEERIVDFVEGKFDVLVCTTIVESGIDMPNVNTIIIDQAQMFGLSQLYQLRGRVGRSDIQAYCYLICPPLRTLTEEARARIESILAHQELGSGFHIANKDLEIRGAGNLLGAEQSGKIASVGLRTYSKMLESAIRALDKKQDQQEEVDPDIQIKYKHFLPDNYVESESERLKVYRALFRCETEQDILGLAESLKDRFGELPEPAVNLVDLVKLKLILRKLGAKSLTQVQDHIFDIRFARLTESQAKSIQTIAEKKKRFVQLGPQFNLLCHARKKGISFLVDLLR